MSIDFQELDYQETPLGDLILRRRRLASLDNREVFEVKLGDAFLMSSLFTKVEIALAELALAELAGDAFDVAVGGLGLGYTACAALDHPSVHSVTVIEALPAVIDWHRRGLVPLGERLASDARCRFVEGDFFARIESDTLDPSYPGKQFDALLLDIDHSPSDLLHPRNATFYSRDGLRRVNRHLRPDGIFAMWSDDPPDDEFHSRLDEAFDESRAHIVSFYNPLLECDSASTVYVARARV